MTEDIDMALAIRESGEDLPQQSDGQSESYPIQKYAGISQQPVTEVQKNILMADVPEEDVQIRPDGMIYLPEILYRKRLNQAFMPGGWALMPTSAFAIRDNTIMRQYALYVGGRFISEVVGEQEYIASNKSMTYATAAEGCKSNALMRCCKDLGIASELWNPNYIRDWVAKHGYKAFNKEKGKYFWRRKDQEPFFWEKEKPSAKKDDAKPEPSAPINDGIL